MKSVRYRLKSVAFDLPLRALDTVRNRKLRSDTSALLIARHSGKRACTYRDFFTWVDANVPDLRTRMRFCRLPYIERDWSSIGAITFWIADSIDVWSPSGHRRAMQLENQAHQNGVGCINSIANLSTTTKSKSTEIWNASGLRAPRCFLVRDASDVLNRNELRYPLLVRDDRGHGRPSILVREPSELSTVPWQNIYSPMIAEFIDTCSPNDGNYRKYRCIVVGNHAVPRHLLVNKHWEVRPEKRLLSDAFRQEELDFVSRPSDHEGQLVYAAQLLGLDIAGIDYSLTADGEVVLWEANPVPNLNVPPSDRAGHLLPAVHRSYAAIARLYLDQLGVSIPPSILELIEDLCHTKE